MQSDTGQKGAGEWRRVSKREPCPICDHPDWCHIGSVFVKCMRVKSDRETSDGGWLHRVNGDIPTRRVFRPKARRLTDSELSARFGPQARHWYVGKNKEIKELAETLGVAAWALDALKVGADADSYTFPELNHHGQIIGVNRRFPDGTKRCCIGSRRGLTFTEDWADAPGPVLIVEGASDVAAGLTLGLCVIGRPSNTGGVEYLKRLLSKHLERRIVIVAERDEKDLTQLPATHDAKCFCCGCCFPGKFGAVQTSIRLSKRLDRIVEWSFVPGHAKDLRGWLTSMSASPNNEQAMRRLAGSLTRRIRHAIH